MTLHHSLSLLIAQIYEGAGDPLLWDRAVQGIMDQTRSRAALLSPTDLDRGQIFNARLYAPDNDKQLHDLTRDYIGRERYRDCPMMRFGLRNPEAGFVRLATAMERPAPGDDDFIRWMKDRLNVKDYVARYTTPRNGMSLSMALVPHPDMAEHDGNDLQLFALLFPHLNEALQIATRPPLVDGSGEPLILLNERGRVCEMNDAAGSLLAEDDGLSIEAGMLRTSLRGEQGRLDGLLRSALDALREGGTGGATTLARPSGRRRLLFRVSPLIHHPASLPAETMRAAAVVKVVDPDALLAEEAPRVWTQMFSLTRAETRLAKALIASEDSLRATAELLGIAYPTARTQLTHLFEKTGVRSQAQLVRLLTRVQG